LVVDAASAPAGVVTLEGSVLVAAAASESSGFGFEATDVVAKPLAGFAAGFFFFLFPPAMAVLVVERAKRVICPSSIFYWKLFFF
jgi:hypothetical protein